MSQRQKNKLASNWQIGNRKKHASLPLMLLVVGFALIASSANAQVSSGGSRQEPGAIDRLLNSDPVELRQGRAADDLRVARTNYEQAPPARMAPEEFVPDGRVRSISTVGARELSETSRPNFIEREKYSGVSTEENSEVAPKKQHFGQLIAKLGMNLAFVLLVGIGCIVVAKQWIKPQTAGSSKKTSDGEKGKLEVAEEIVLDGKSKLRVIHWKGTDVLVASDANGVRSMVALSPSFSEALDQVETEYQEREIETPRSRTEPRENSRLRTVSNASKPEDRGVDDRLIQMLLESADRSAKASRSYSGKGNA